jgi:hypothetical protein
MTWRKRVAEKGPRLAYIVENMRDVLPAGVCFEERAGRTIFPVVDREGNATSRLQVLLRRDCPELESTILFGIEPASACASWEWLFRRRVLRVARAMALAKTRADIERLRELQ